MSNSPSPRKKSTARHTRALARVLRETRTLKESLVRVGSGKDACQHVLRLAEVWHPGQWYRYLTNVPDSDVLPAEVVVALYWQRWRIEDAFLIVKRLLGLLTYPAKT